MYLSQNIWPEKAEELKICPPKNSYQNVQRNFRQILKITQMFVNEWTDKLVVQPHNRMLLSKARDYDM